MLDELRARFRTRFVETARGRVKRARELAMDSDLASVAVELHSLAGEASLLEYVDCARCARAAEQLARSGEGRRCKDALEPLAEAIEAVAKSD
jgi:hypothetical protein